jgi:hypothetical protein
MTVEVIEDAATGVRLDCLFKATGCFSTCVSLLNVSGCSPFAVPPAFASDQWDAPGRLIPVNGVEVDRKALPDLPRLSSTADPSSSEDGSDPR